MSKSWIENAIGNNGGSEKGDSRPPQWSNADATMSKDDAEIAKIASQLDISVKIIGCGGGGSNTINRIVQEGIIGAQVCAVNTDAKHLLSIKSPKKILIGRTITKGLGAGAQPEIGEAAARESENELKAFLRDANIVFLTAGMGGGTGTGASHYIARLAKNNRSLVIGVVTLPFKAEGEIRMENALEGLERLRRVCDTTIVIPNDKLLELVPKLPVDAAFRVADEVLMQTIKGLTEIITKPGLVNLDYSDLRTIMDEGGVALIGIGESDDAEPMTRVENAVSEALNSPLLGGIDLSEAKGALIRVVGGPDMSVSQAEKAAALISGKMPRNARIIWGCSIEKELEGRIKILLIVTGAKAAATLAGGSTSLTEIEASDDLTSDYDATGSVRKMNVEYVR